MRQLSESEERRAAALDTEVRRQRQRVAEQEVRQAARLGQARELRALLARRDVPPAARRLMQAQLARCLGSGEPAPMEVSAAWPARFKIEGERR